ncbi:hypothetical protein ATY76_13320 [Rhizobium sp. R339]|nr:hypothetical protein ATY76_13320 [Rhizobium sp. R339]
MWVGGHYGEYDWSPINANTREEAIRELLNSWGYYDLEEGETPEDALKSNSLTLERASGMDGLQVEEIGNHHWISAGFGSHCSRCDTECSPEEGAIVIGTEVICEDCKEIRDLLIDDPERAEERLVEVFMMNDCDEAAAREVLIRDVDVDIIPSDMWAKCLAEARAEQ